jgi:nicotinate phosphoribosyltransferase
LLVDTYDTKKGILNAICVAKEFKTRGYLLKGIRLDSGNILKLSKMAREMLDREGLKEVKIFASGDLDEYKIEELDLAAAPIDDLGVGTKMGASSDAPSLDVIYKISEVTNDHGVFLPTMKLSQDKVTLPGRKQVFRLYDKRGAFKKDIIGLETENLGEPLLKQVIHAGEVVYPPVPISVIREAALKNLRSIRKGLKTLRGGCTYPVLISPGLKKMMKALSKELEKRQSA